MIMPSRACLYVPANNPRALAKAPSLGADVIILDLEDGVGLSDKDLARASALDFLANNARIDAAIMVRVNNIHLDLGKEDLRVLAHGAPSNLAGILLPKVEKADDIHVALSEGGAALSEKAIWAMIETPIGLLALPDICQAKAIKALVFGINDMALAYGVNADEAHPLLTHARLTMLSYGKAFSLLTIDGVVNQFSDAEASLALNQQSAFLGFDGRSLIHPSQIAPALAAYRPSQSDIVAAFEVVNIFALAENRGKGVVNLNGQMVEQLHLLAAKRLLARAGLIGAEMDGAL